MDLPQQQTATSTSPSPPQPTRISFADLPFEIRHQIWNLTFEPRILCLHINQHVTPAPVGCDGKKIHNSPRTLSIGFDCSIVTTSPSNEFDEYRAEYRARQTRLATLKLPAEPLTLFDDDNDNASFEKECEEYAEQCAQLAAVEAAGQTLSGGKATPGPATLYVCQESRALALKRYKLAFGRAQLDAPYSFFCNVSYELGDNSMWEKARFGKPRIWVDFDQDIIVVDSFWKPMVVQYPSFKFPEQAAFGPLSLIRIFAKEESKNIRRLGVAARHLTQEGWDVVSVLQGRVFCGPQTATSPSVTKEWLLGFDNLKEIVLDDVPHAGYHREIPGWPSPNSQLQYQPLMTMKEEILHHLGKRSAADPGFAAHPPEIRMVGGTDWSSFF